MADINSARYLHPKKEAVHPIFLTMSFHNRFFALQ